MDTAPLIAPAWKMEFAYHSAIMVAPSSVLRTAWQTAAGIALVFVLNAWFATSTATSMAVVSAAGQQAVNECAVNNGGCSVGMLCTDTPTSFTCTSTCGDGIRAGSEQCDQGNVTNGDGCSSTMCQIEAGFTCAGSSSVCTSTCGDGIRAGSEQCDQGNVTNGDGCSSVCTVEPGFQCVGSPSVCIDINECMTNNGGCSSNPPVTLSDTPGRAQCGACPSGYTGNGITCTDVNECQTNNGGCGTGSCANTLGGYSCTAPTNDALTPSVYCVMPDPSSPTRSVALFVYKSTLQGINNQPYFYDYDSNNNALRINDIDQGPLLGVPSVLLARLSRERVLGAVSTHRSSDLAGARSAERESASGGAHTVDAPVHRAARGPTGYAGADNGAPGLPDRPVPPALMDCRARRAQRVRGVRPVRQARRVRRGRRESKASPVRKARRVQPVPVSPSSR